MSRHSSAHFFSCVQYGRKSEIKRPEQFMTKGRGATFTYKKLKIIVKKSNRLNVVTINKKHT